MDLDTIIMHLDNFVDTWDGWGKIFGGLQDAATSSFLDLFNGTEGEDGTANGGIFNTSSELSSVFDTSSTTLEGSSEDISGLSSE